MTITVISLDDHYLVREGIRRVLDEHRDVVLVGEGSTGVELFPLVSAHQPDVVLLDLQMPHAQSPAGKPYRNFHAFSAVAQLRQEFPSVNVIIVSQHINQSLAEGAVDAGVRGYILKEDALTRQLVAAIRIVEAGGVYFSEQVHQYLTGQYESKTLGILSDRHIEVLRAMALHPDWLQAVHAQNLGISESTLKKHLKQIYKALDASNLASAIIKAIQLRIIPTALIDPMVGLSLGAVDVDSNSEKTD